MKKIAVLFLCLIVFFGCARKKHDTNTITLWHWMSDRDDVFQELAHRYAEQTGINVKIELYAPTGVYTQKIFSSAQAGILPDVYGILDKKSVFAEFIKDGFVSNLTPYFEANDKEWESSIFQKALNVNRFLNGNPYKIRAGIYGVPIDVTNIQMVYNKDLLAQVGYKRAPITFEEFLDVIDALNGIGHEGLVFGWSELWMVKCLAANYAFNIMGEEKVMATYRGEVPYTDSDWIKVFEVFKTLSEKKAFVKGIVKKPNKVAERDFALGRAAFAFNGSWSVNVYHEMNPKLSYGVMMPPVFNKERPMSIWGGAGSSFVVNDSSLNKEKAAAFLKWLTAKDQQAYLAGKTKNLPSNRKALSDIPDVLSEFASAMDYTTHPTIWEQDELPLVDEVFIKGLQSIISGEKTPQQVAMEVQMVKTKEMKE